MNPIAKKSSRRGSGTATLTTPQSGPIYVPPTSQDYEAWLTSLRRDSHASHTPLLDAARESPTNGTSGPRRVRQLMQYDPATLHLKTSQVSYSPTMESLTLSPFLETLPDWGTMQDGVLWELETLAHPTGGIAGSAWPTPQSSDGGQGAVHPKSMNFYQTESGWLRKIANTGVEGSAGLARTAEIAWESARPTPRANRVTSVSQDYAQQRLWKLNLEDWAAVFPSGPQSQEIGTDGQESLPSTQNSPQLWATPDASVMNEGDTKWQERREREKAKHRNGNGFGLTLGMQVNKKLNPLFVEWLMGLPIGHTDLKPLGTA